jgi:hypothetical protein
MRVRILRQPTGFVNGVSLKHYHAGEVYDLPPALAEYLVIEEYAMFEMRDQLRRHLPVAVDRRRQS